MKRVSGFFIILAILAGTIVPAYSAYGANRKGIDIYGGAASLGGWNEIYDTQEPDLSEPIESTHIDLSGRINNGILIGDVNVSGMTYDEAKSAVFSYVNKLKGNKVTMLSVDDVSTVVSVADLGVSWENEDVLVEALSLGKSGNVVNRYKALKDLEHSNHVYDLKLKFDREAVKRVIESQAEQYNVKGENATISRENGQFKIVPGTTGYGINVDASVNNVINALSAFAGKDTTIKLTVETLEPKGRTEDLQKIKDVLGTYTTSFKTSGKDRTGNVRNGTKLINGTILYPGEQFSAYETVSPFTEENGYFLAGSYLNGMVVETFGGGICQVSSTLYNAVIRAELQVDERSSHSMIVNYVDLSSDAAISGTSKDFKFTNNTDYPIYIEGYTTEDKQVTFNVYGVETRPENRKVEFESVELSKTEPVEDKLIADPSQPVGYISVQSAHIGYSGELWKIVKIDGEEKERVRLNKSHYAMAPRTATVGTGGADAAVSAALAAAMQTNNIDVVKNTIAQLKAAAAAATVIPAAPPEPIDPAQ